MGSFREKPVKEQTDEELAHTMSGFFPNEPEYIICTNELERRKFVRERNLKIILAVIGSTVAIVTAIISVQ